jgi:hypothetical protein
MEDSRSPAWAWKHLQLDTTLQSVQESDQRLETEALESPTLEIGHTRLVRTDRAGGDQLLVHADRLEQFQAELLL